MGKIKNYDVGIAKPLDKVTVSDADTGETKNIYLNQIIEPLEVNSFRAFLTQAGNAAVTNVVFESNTIEGTWSRVSAGVYDLTSTGSFDSDYISCHFTTPNAQENTFDWTKSSANAIRITTYLGGTPSDDVMNNQYFEIKVYGNLD